MFTNSAMDNDIIKAIRATITTMKATSCGTVVMSGSEYQKLMMQLSALYEGARNEAREQRGKNQQLVTVIEIMSGYLGESLEMFEAMFESDEGCFSYERMAEYVTIARFMGAYRGRKHIADRVDQRMRELPFGN